MIQKHASLIRLVLLLVSAAWFILVAFGGTIFSMNEVEEIGAGLAFLVGGALLDTKSTP